MRAAVPNGRKQSERSQKDNDEIEVNLSAFSAPVVASWFDPVRGRSSIEQMKRAFPVAVDSTSRHPFPVEWLGCHTGAKRSHAWSSPIGVKHK
jgi:hypothetical protein